MKRTFVILMAATCVFAGCSRSLRFTVESDVTSAGLPSYADSVMIEYETMVQPLKAAVQKKAFTIEGKVDKPVLAQIRAVGRDRKSSKTLILEKGTISFQNGLACGTPLNDATLAFTHHLKEVAEQHKGSKDLLPAIEEAFASFVNEHKNDPCAAYAILLAKGRLPKDVITKLIASAGPDVQNHGDVRSLSRMLQNAGPDE